jgi:hypothetical protein
MRDIPLRERKPKKRLEDNSEIRSSTTNQFPIPQGEPSFRDGYRECVEMFSLHAPNKRFVGKILDEHCVLLEDACVRSPSRENYARYEGYRQAVKDLRKAKRMK